MNKNKKALIILSILKKEYQKYQRPVSTYFQETTNDPFKVLISTILSARARDAQTEKVSKELFKIADKPQKITKLDIKKLQKIIYTIGFYKTKSKRVQEASKYLIKNHHSKVPQTFEELIKIPGVGRKVANIILAECFGKNVIPVDIHQFRIPNRIGLIQTKNSLETEEALMKIFPKKEWKTLNRYFVAFGQNVCLPISPKCSSCPINNYCQRRGVTRSR